MIILPGAEYLWAPFFGRSPLRGRTKERYGWTLVANVNDQWSKPMPIILWLLGVPLALVLLLMLTGVVHF
jgi:hypothetical protein